MAQVDNTNFNFDIPEFPVGGETAPASAPAVSPAGTKPAPSVTTTATSLPE